MSYRWTYLAWLLLAAFCIGSFWLAAAQQESPKDGDIVFAEDDVKTLIDLYTQVQFRQQTVATAEASLRAAKAEMSAADLQYQNRLLQMKSKYKIPDDYELKSNDKQLFFRKKPEDKK